MNALAPSSELIVDSFAGGGGASLGIEMALGRSPDIAKQVADFDRMFGDEE